MTDARPNWKEYARTDETGWHWREGMRPTVEQVFDRMWGYWCISDVSFSWDQWAGCWITCSHGRYRGTSNGQGDAFGGSLFRAFEVFVLADVVHDWEG